MLILLPPSEAKTPGGDGPAVDLEGLAAPRLAGTRRRVVDAVAGLAQDQPERAAEVLKLPPAAREAALAADAAAATSATLPALDRYAGVVYQGLDVASMTPAVRRRAEQGCLVLSGLLGIVRGSDRVPDYRVPVSAVLPDLGGLTPLWRAALRDTVPALLGRSFCVDLRSTDYAGMWPPTGPLRHQVLPVRVLSPRPKGEPRVISHFSKHGKGVLARALLEQATGARSADDVADVARGLGWGTALRHTQGGVPALDVVLPA
ncbi:hypothetical protein EV189_0151 [Motilibacter rhizosphaerae]|uniref:Peroxide stress protein YaaA n=1 Tax=Motilibacter rhizosphaerae TaxID=598652 RepID=A0A4Q7NUP0_9ACTN|nr:peroxide stress protein YaaA [Motilibacter rhizosphaerae]RZS90921.1 hypothetical protein EV189_0151 [Motilibacter rhizosphaerae]